MAQRWTINATQFVAHQQRGSTIAKVMDLAELKVLSAARAFQVGNKDHGGRPAVGCTNPRFWLVHPRSSFYHEPITMDK
jgi:hypothetical protein